MSLNPWSRSCGEGTLPTRVAVHAEGDNGLDVELRGQLTKRGAAGAELTIEDDEAHGTLLLSEDAPASLELEVGIEMFTAAQLERE